MLTYAGRMLTYADVFRTYADACRRMQVKMLELVLEDQRADKAYDLPRITALAKTLEEEAALYTDAKMTLMLLESALSVDSFSVDTQVLH